jgi:hypothetical protein
LAWRLVRAGYLRGAGEVCIAPSPRPDDRRDNPATRGQVSKSAATTFFSNDRPTARR